MKVGFLTALTFVAVATPAFADEIICVDPEHHLEIALDVDFNVERDGGTVTDVHAVTENFVLTTRPNEAERPETIAFSNVAFDRIEVGLESFNVGPMTLTLDLVRAATYSPDGGPDSEVVVAGVVRYGTSSTATLVCTGWQ